MSLLLTVSKVIGAHLQLQDQEKLLVYFLCLLFFSHYGTSTKTNFSATFETLEI